MPLLYCPSPLRALTLATVLFSTEQRANLPSYPDEAHSPTAALPARPPRQDTIPSTTPDFVAGIRRLTPDLALRSLAILDDVCSQKKSQEAPLDPHTGKLINALYAELDTFSEPKLRSRIISLMVRFHPDALPALTNRWDAIQTHPTRKIEYAKELITQVGESGARGRREVGTFLRFVKQTLEAHNETSGPIYDACAEALGNLGDPIAIPLLGAAVRDFTRSETERILALDKLGRIEAHDATQELAQLCSSVALDTDYRFLALEILEKKDRALSQRCADEGLIPFAGPVGLAEEKIDLGRSLLLHATKSPPSPGALAVARAIKIAGTKQTVPVRLAVAEVLIRGKDPLGADILTSYFQADEATLERSVAVGIYAHDQREALVQQCTRHGSAAALRTCLTLVHTNALTEPVKMALRDRFAKKHEPAIVDIVARFDPEIVRDYILQNPPILSTKDSSTWTYALREEDVSMLLPAFEAAAQGCSSLEQTAQVLTSLTATLAKHRAAAPNLAPLQASLTTHFMNGVQSLPNPPAQISPLLDVIRKLEPEQKYLACQTLLKLPLAINQVTAIRQLLARSNEVSQLVLDQLFSPRKSDQRVGVTALLADCTPARALVVAEILTTPERHELALRIRNALCKMSPMLNAMWRSDIVRGLEHRAEDPEVTPEAQDRARSYAASLKKSSSFGYQLPFRYSAHGLAKVVADRSLKVPDSRRVIGVMLTREDTVGATFDMDQLLTPYWEHGDCVRVYEFGGALQIKDGARREFVKGFFAATFSSTNKVPLKPAAQHIIVHHGSFSGGQATGSAFSRDTRRSTISLRDEEFLVQSNISSTLEPGGTILVAACETGDDGSPLNGPKDQTLAYDTAGAMYRRVFPYAAPEQVIAPRFSVPLPTPKLTADGAIEHVWSKKVDARY